MSREAERMWWQNRIRAPAAARHDVVCPRVETAS